VAGLGTGQFAATITYANGTSSDVVVRFDFGGEGQPARLASQTTYRAVTGARAAEQITIGDQTWTRQPGQPWLAAPTTQGVREELQALLPGTEALVAQGQSDGPNALRWYDAARNADVRLEFDPLTGTPLRMQQTTRGTGAVLTVTYQGWNTPVQIASPTGP
jgi:hypothetical protein